MPDATNPPGSVQHPMSAQDALWLTMDRPNNLMVIDGVMLLESMPDWETVLDTVTERVLDRFWVFRCRAQQYDDRWVWEEDANFDLEQHVHRVQLPEPCGVAELEEYVADMRSRPLPRDRPLWEVAVVDGVVTENGESGAAIVSRFHHSIADGVRLTQVMLSLCDTSDPHVAAPVGRRDANSGPAALATTAAEAVAEAVTDTARAVTRGAAAVGDDARGALLSGWRIATDLLRHPAHLVDAFDAMGVDSRLANTTGSVAKLALRGSTVQTIWSGTPGVRKAVAWSAPFALEPVKTIGRAYDASVNDVLLTAIAGGLHDYLQEHGAGDITEVEWMVPVNLLPIDDNLPDDLGNYFALVMAVLPLLPDDSIERLRAVSARMSRIKRSAEPLLTFGVQRGVSAAPGPLSVALTDFFANKAVGVLTNVPGPRAPMSFAGASVRQIVGFAPSSGDQPMTCTIFSYAGNVTIGFATDAGLIPKPAHLVDNTLAELARLVDGDR